MKEFLQAVQEAREAVDYARRRQKEDESAAIRESWNQVRHWWKAKVGSDKGEAIWQIESRDVQDGQLILESPVIDDHQGRRSYALSVPLDEVQNFTTSRWHVYDSGRLLAEADQHEGEIDQGLANVQALFYGFSVLLEETRGSGHSGYDSGFGGVSYGDDYS